MFLSKENKYLFYTAEREKKNPWCHQIQYSTYYGHPSSLIRTAYRSSCFRIAVSYNLQSRMTWKKGIDHILKMVNKSDWTIGLNLLLYNVNQNIKMPFSFSPRRASGLSSESFVQACNDPAEWATLAPLYSSRGTVESVKAVLSPHSMQRGENSPQNVTSRTFDCKASYSSIRLDTYLFNYQVGNIISNSHATCQAWAFGSKKMNETGHTMPFGTTNQKVHEWEDGTMVQWML